MTKIFVENDLLLTDIFNILISNRETFGNTRYILAGIVIVTLPLMVATSGVLALVFFGVGLILSGALYLVDWGGFIGPTTALLWFIVAIIILIVKINRGRDG